MHRALLGTLFPAQDVRPRSLHPDGPVVTEGPLRLGEQSPDCASGQPKMPRHPSDTPHMSVLSI